MITNPHAFYRFSAPGTSISDVVVLRGDAPPIPDGGAGKWEVIDRPKRKGVTRYVGSDPLKLAISVLFDGWTSNISVERDIARLIAMSREVSGEPPKITVNEKSKEGLPITDYGMRWVIDSIAWGQNALYEVDGDDLVRYRQDATVNLVEWVPITTLKVGQSGSGTGAKGTGARHKTHVVKKGETLPIIAVREYGDRSKWKAIAKRNNISDPRHIKIGQTLVMP
jgi:hypothetical protein